MENGINNQWDNGTLGNYWGYYVGNDLAPYDGIVDTPFDLDGDVYSKDYKPLMFSVFGDLDGDGLGNLEEYTLGIDGYLTNVINPDSDDDGLTDYWEYQYNTNPIVADTDGDGYSDGEEILAGTDPLDPSSYPPSLPPPDYTLPIILGITFAGILIALAIILHGLLVRKRGSTQPPPPKKQVSQDPKEQPSTQKEPSKSPKK